MKRSWVKAGVLLIVGLAMISFANMAYSRVVGPLMDQEMFPDMLQKKPDCNKAYNQYAAAAKPIDACHNLDEAKNGLATQDTLITELSDVKSCKDCKNIITSAQSEKTKYQEQISRLEGQCPSEKEQHKLVEKLPDLRKQVCKSCENKWPGDLGPHNVSPCSF